MATPNYYVTNLYRFTPVADPPALAQELKAFAIQKKLLGLVILAPEGVNGTLVGRDLRSLIDGKDWLKGKLGLEQREFKDAESPLPPFPKFKVRVRPEIVTLHRPELTPVLNDASYLTPEEWHKWLGSDREFSLVDARNDYEVRIGAFKNAINPHTRQFTELPDVIEHRLEVDKTKPLLMYCTGGIRCEKAALEMRRRGFQEVYQLHGGILKYLEKFPNQEFEGECFVFDDRVAVDQKLLATTQYTLCPHCGDPADRPVVCNRCSHQGQICARCAEMPVRRVTCSRDCAHHHRLRPERKLKTPRPGRFAQKR